MSETFPTIRGVAGYLSKATEKAVYGLAQKRKIPCFEMGGQWRFRRSALRAWIERHQEGQIDV